MAKGDVRTYLFPMPKQFEHTQWEAWVEGPHDGDYSVGQGETELEALASLFVAAAHCEWGLYEDPIVLTA